LEPKSFQNHPREAPSPKTKSLVKPLYLLCFFKIRPSKKQQKGGKFSQKSHCENDRHKSKKKTVFLTKCDHQNHPKSSTNAPKTLSKTTPEKNEKTIQKGHAGAAHRRLNPPNTRVKPRPRPTFFGAPPLGLPPQGPSGLPRNFNRAKARFPSSAASLSEGCRRRVRPEPEFFKYPRG
jgi:hypothetical protein